MSKDINLNKISKELFETQSEWSPNTHRTLEDIHTVAELNDFLFHTEHSLKKTVKSNIKLLDRVHPESVEKTLADYGASQGSLGLTKNK